MKKIRYKCVDCFNEVIGMRHRERERERDRKVKWLMIGTNIASY